MVVLSVLTLFAAMGAPPVASAPTIEHPTLSDGFGIHVVDTTWLSDRLVDVTMTTDALDQTVHVRLLVPDGYGADPARRYSSTYLLHGCRAGTPDNGLGYQEWTVGMRAEDVTADADTIVVMPDGGGGGFYTDWFNGGAGGNPKWETYHISQLLPWVDQNFRTIPERSQRAIAGLSMGGFGALSYASRHPDLFGSAASFSGAVDLTYPQEEAEPASTVVVDACASSDGGAPGSTFGSHVDDELNWWAHDPPRLVENLRNTQIYLYTGNGQPGPLDPPGRPVDGIEVLAERATIGFHDRLEEVGIPHYFENYGAGSHSAPYWERDLRDALPRFLDDFALARSYPSFTFKSELASYDRFGWHVELARSAPEFSILADAGVDGFTLSGSGSAVVTTAALYEPGEAYRITIDNAANSNSMTVRAGDDRRLLIDSLPLGPPNPFQELSPAALAAGGTKVYTATVSVQRASDTTTTSSSPPAPPPDRSGARPAAVAATPIAGSPRYTG